VEPPTGENSRILGVELLHLFEIVETLTVV
jgi:hypothetical protein